MTATSSPVSTTARPQRAFPPRTVGPWKIDALLAEHTLTRVYRARPANCSMERPADYVLKLLRKDAEQDALAIEMMCREAYVGCRVSHPHLVPVLDASVNAAPYYVVTPQLPGASLEDILFPEKWLPIPIALWMVRQAAEALAALHEQGWLHGDVKPSNLIVAPDGHVTVIDLGLARRLGRAGHVSDRPPTGTYHYLAPELVTSTHPTDQRSDIYSLGITLYRSLTGRLPFQADTVDRLLQAHREAIAPDPRRLRTTLPREVSLLVRQMLSKQPMRRPAAAAEVVERLIALEIETFDQRFAA